MKLFLSGIGVNENLFAACSWELRLLCIPVQIVRNDHRNDLMKFEKDSSFYFEYLSNKVDLHAH